MIRNLKVVFANVKAALMRRGRSAQDAEDLMQEAWVRLASYGQDKPVHSPEAFLMRTALNLSVDRYRHELVQGELVSLEDVVLLDVAPSAEAAVLGKERVARLAVCLGRLTERTRDIFLAHRIDGMTYAEIAEAYGISVSAVEQHVSKAMLQITCGMEGW